LPLPQPIRAEAAKLFPATNLTPPSPHPSERTAHMAMIAGLQYRQRDSHQHSQLATIAPEQASNVPPIEAQSVRHLNRGHKIKAVSLSIPIGRAPPRLA